MNPVTIGTLQIIPAIILIAYGWIKQKKYRVGENNYELERNF